MEVLQDIFSFYKEEALKDWNELWDWLFEKVSFIYSASHCRLLRVLQKLTSSEYPSWGQKCNFCPSKCHYFFFWPYSVKFEFPVSRMKDSHCRPLCRTSYKRGADPSRIYQIRGTEIQLECSIIKIKFCSTGHWTILVIG